MVSHIDITARSGRAACESEERFRRLADSALKDRAARVQGDCGCERGVRAMVGQRSQDLGSGGGRVLKGWK